MKRKIKFLLALSTMLLSCTNLTKPTVLNWNGHGNATGNNQALIGNEGAANERTCPCCIKMLDFLIKQYRADITGIIENINVGYSSDQNVYSTDLYLHLFDQPYQRPKLNTNEVKSPLALAVFSGSLNIASAFIEFLTTGGTKVDINAKDLFGQSVLHYAIGSGHKEMVKVLIQKAPLVHIYGKDQALDLPALLDHAIHYSTIEIVQLLIDAGADPNCPYNREKAGDYGNGFRRTVVYNRKDIAIYFIANNLIKDWNKPDQYGHTALMYVASSPDSGWSPILDMLIQKGADIKAKDWDGHNVLIHLLKRYTHVYRIYRESLDEFILAYNCNLSNAKDIFKYVCNDKKELLKSLFNHKDISEITKGNTPLKYAQELLCEMRKVDTNEAQCIQDILNLLLDIGFNN